MRHFRYRSVVFRGEVRLSLGELSSPHAIQSSLELAFRSRSDRATLRAGFTLLEVVLALGLSSLLLAAVYAALQMHWTYSMTGQIEMERAQLARAIFRRMEIDIRSVVLPSNVPTTSSSTTISATPDSPDSESDTTAGSSSSTSSLTSGTSDSGETTATQKTGLFGDSQTLVLHVSLPSRLSNTSAGGAAADALAPAFLPPSDLQSVAYFLRDSTSTLAQQLSSGMPTTDGQPASGLCRMQGDRAAMQVADEMGDLSLLASQTKLMAAEVATVSFEFFDGVSWGTSWDSGGSGNVPNAIRITLSFAAPDQSKRGWFARPVSASTDSYSHTVALPLAEPYVSE